MNIIGGVLRLGRGRGDTSHDSGRESSQERPTEVEEGREGSSPATRIPSAKELGLRREFHVPHSKSQRRLGYYLKDKCFRKWRFATLQVEVFSEHQGIKQYFFSGWKLHACTSLVAWKCADHFHDRILQHLQEECFKEWRNQVQFRRYITGIKSRYFKEWSGGACDGPGLGSNSEEGQESGEEIQEVGDQAGRIIIKWAENMAKRKLVLRVFYRWCENVCLEPAWQVQRILAWRQRKITRVAFTAWCQNVDHQKLSRETGTQLLENVLVKHMFSSWLDAAMVAEGEGKSKNGEGVIVGGLKGASILEARRRENAAMEGWARIMRSKKVLRAAFVLWKEDARPQALEFSVKWAASQRRRQCASTVIKSWNEFAEAKHVQAVLVGRFQARQERLLIRKSLQGWCSMKNRMVIARVAEYRAECHFSKRFLVKYLRQWHMDCLRQQDRCLATRICSNLYTRSTVHRALKAWEDFTARENHYRMVIHKIEMERMGRVCHEWLDATQEAARQRCNSNSAVEHRERSILRGVLKTWNDVVNEKVGTQYCEAEAFHVEKLLKKCFLAFRVVKDQASVVQDCRRISAMKSSFAKWWEAVLRTRMACKILQEIKRRCSVITQAKFFLCWRAVTKQQLYFTAQHRSYQVMKLGWTAWFSVYVARLTVEADRVQRSKMRHNFMKGCFIAWHREAYMSYRAQAKNLLNLVKENIHHLKPSHIPGPSMQTPGHVSPAATLTNVQNLRPQGNVPPDFIQNYGGDPRGSVRQSMYLSHLESEIHPRPS